VAFGTGCSHAIRPKYHQTETPQGMDDGEFAVVGIEGLVAQSVLIDDAGTTPGRRAGGAVDGDHGRPASGAATDLGVENRARHVRRIRRPDAARRGATVPGARADETRALGSVGDPAIDQVNIWVDRLDTDPARTGGCSRRSTAGPRATTASSSTSEGRLRNPEHCEPEMPDAPPAPTHPPRAPTRTLKRRQL